MVSAGRLLAAVLVPLMLTAIPAHAAAHAAFVESQPQPGVRLEAGPAEIRVEFTEPLDRSLAAAVLVNTETGRKVPSEAGPGEERELVLRPTERLARAPYRVDWHTVSTVDGHALEGSFSFGVQTAAVQSGHDLEQSPLARAGWLRIAGRGLFYAALFFFAGGLFARVALGRGGEPAAWLIPDAERLDPVSAARADRMWRWTLSAGWLAVTGAIAVTVAESLDASGSRGAEGVSDFLLSNDAGLARLVMSAAVLLAVTQASRLPLAASAWLAIAFGAIALGGHANSAEPRVWAVLSDWIHLLAAAVWIGGLAQIALFWTTPWTGRRGRDRLAAVRSVLPRFGRVALPAFVVVVVSGGVNALIELGHPEALWETAYGRVLSVKIALVGAIAIVSYLHALRIRPLLLRGNPHVQERLQRRHWRMVAAEPFLALGAIAAVAALVTFPLPPDQLGEAGEASAAAPCEPCPLEAARDAELPVANQAGPNIAAFWLRRQPGELTATVRLLDNKTKPVDEADVEASQGEVSDCGGGCWRVITPPGATLTVAVNSGGAERTVSVPARSGLATEQRARRILRRAQAAMRRLGTLRMRESLTSGLGEGVRSHYRFAAPDRMSYRTDSGTRVVAIGKTGYTSIGGEPFHQGPFGADGFQFARLFRWTAYGRDVRLLPGVRRVIRLAVYDPATPVWYLLEIDRRSHRVLEERMVAPGHFMDRRYFGFDLPVRIVSPR